MHLCIYEQAKAGHSEAARYLLAKGADVTAVDDNGDSALSLAATTSMVSLLKGQLFSTLISENYSCININYQLSITNCLPQRHGLNKQ